MGVNGRLVYHDYNLICWMHMNSSPWSSSKTWSIVFPRMNALKTCLPPVHMHTCGSWHISCSSDYFSVDACSWSRLCHWSIWCYFCPTNDNTIWWSLHWNDIRRKLHRLASWNIVEMVRHNLNWWRPTFNLRHIWYATTNRLLVLCLHVHMPPACVTKFPNLA